MSDLLDTLNNPVLQTGLSVLTKSNPALGLALDLFKTLAQGWQTNHEISVAIKAIDKRAAQHIKRLISKDISKFARSELEIRLHEDLAILMQLGGI
jgi:hypothetical protein